MSAQLRRSRRDAWILLVVLPFLSACMASSRVKERQVGGMVVASYFHGTIRCQACLEIERLSESVITERFAPELKSGKLVWKTIDYDQPQNAHYSKHYQLPFPSLVIARFQNGQEKEWKRLSKTWDLVEKDPDALMTYVQEEVVALLARAD